MTRDEYLAAVGKWERFFGQILLGIIEPYLESVRGVYVETWFESENEKHEALALVVTGKTLQVYDLITEGHRDGDQQDTISCKSIPLREIRVVRTRLVRRGWGRGVDTRHLEETGFRAEIEGTETSVSIPKMSQVPDGSRSRYLAAARAFADALLQSL